jgi:hypothetical protein
MRKFEKNCVALVRQEATIRALQKLPEISTIPPESNSFYLKEILKENKLILKESKRHSSLLSCIKNMFAMFCKSSRGKKSVPSVNALTQNNTALQTYAFLINQNGSRALTKRRYEKIRACANKYDIFIDGFTRKVFRKNSKSVFLSDSEFIMIKTYIETGKPLAPFQITGYVKEYKRTEENIAWNTKRLHDLLEQSDIVDDREWEILKNEGELSEEMLCSLSESATKVFECARRKVDIKDDKEFLHFPQVQRKGRDRIAKYQFNPGSLHYCLIVPV